MLSEAEIKKRRLRGKCRRGMLELDIILAGFFDQHYSALSLDEQDAFAALLAEEDVTLYAWFIESETPKDPLMQALVARISSSFSA